MKDLASRVRENRFLRRWGSFGMTAGRIPQTETLICPELGLEDRVRVLHVDTLRWLKHVEASIQIQAPPSPWIIFACPPYRMWLAEREKLIPGLDELFRLAPADSALVCETDRTFDLPSAMEHLEWDTRNYEPAFVSIARK
jgi:16S rRNA (guanine966-N2)-methyltransferase